MSRIMSGKELELECKIVELKSKIRYCAGIIESINTSLLKEQVNGNEDVKLSRDRLRDVADLMRNDSL